jgi:hypothetical protein
MHPEMMFRAADIDRRERLEEATRRREAMRFVTSRVPARTRVPHRRSA